MYLLLSLLPVLAFTLVPVLSYNVFRRETVPCQQCYGRTVPSGKKVHYTWNNIDYAKGYPILNTIINFKAIKSKIFGDFLTLYSTFLKIFFQV